MARWDRACMPQDREALHTLDSRFSSTSPSSKDEEEEVRSTWSEIDPTTGQVLSFLIFLVATVAASDQRRMGDGEWAEVNIGAAIGHFHFELRRGANWTV